MKMVQRKQKGMHMSPFKISHLANNLGLAVEGTEDCKEKLKLLEDRQKKHLKKRLSFKENGWMIGFQRLSRGMTRKPKQLSDKLSIESSLKYFLAK